MTKVATRIKEKLEASFQPSHLEIIDESHLHAGHAGAREGGESHFHVLITARNFSGLSRVDAQRKIYDALKEELAGPVHALRLTVKVP